MVSEALSHPRRIPLYIAPWTQCERKLGQAECLVGPRLQTLSLSRLFRWRFSLERVLETGIGSPSRLEDAFLLIALIRREIIRRGMGNRRTLIFSAFQFIKRLFKLEEEMNGELRIKISEPGDYIYVFPPSWFFEKDDQP